VARVLGWNRPTEAHYARCKAGPPARDILDDVVPADKVDNSRLCKVLNQLNLGSCTANAWAQIVRAAMIYKNPDSAPEFMSRLMTYWLARREDGTVTSDAGSQICTVADACCRMGFCPESVWPYDVTKFAKKPSPEAIWAAYDQKGKIDVNYHRIDQGVSGDSLILLVRKALTAGYLVTWGTQVSKVYCSGDLGPDPVKPPIGVPIAGGHAQVLADFDWTVPKPRFRNLNSWGLDFGQGGFCDVDPTYVSWSGSSDMWICTVAPRFTS
jgi:hypothetical protein